MERLEASLIDTKILALMHDTLQQPIATTLEQRLSGGSGAVYCPVPSIPSLLFQRSKKSSADTLPAERHFHDAGSGPGSQVAMAGNGLGLERSNTTDLASPQRHDTEWQA